MLTEIADGVWVHESEFIQSNTTVVKGDDGVLVVDPGITTTELENLAHDLHELGQPVVAGFSTHPDWDHVLWHQGFGDVPRYATARGAAAMAELLDRPDWKTLVSGVTPPEYANDFPFELFGRLTGLPEGATELPWNGPTIRIIEHRAHASGHAALFLPDTGVLIAGDMLSDILMPFLDLDSGDPLGDYLAALRLFEGVAAGVTSVIPGHGSVGGSAQVPERITLDRAYVQALHDGVAIDDYRVGPQAPLYWLPEVNAGQVERLAAKRAGTSS